MIPFSFLIPWIPGAIKAAYKQGLIDAIGRMDMNKRDTELVNMAAKEINKSIPSFPVEGFDSVYHFMCEKRDVYNKALGLINISSLACPFCSEHNKGRINGKVDCSGCPFKETNYDCNDGGEWSRIVELKAELGSALHRFFTVPKNITITKPKGEKKELEITVKTRLSEGELVYDLTVTKQTHRGKEFGSGQIMFSTRFSTLAFKLRSCGSPSAVAISDGYFFVRGDDSRYDHKVSTTSDTKAVERLLQAVKEYNEYYSGE